MSGAMGTGRRESVNGPGALILGGAHGSLAVARSLGRRGIPVCFLTADHPLVRYSRYVSRSMRWHGPGAADALDDLLGRAQVEGWEGWLLVPGSDADVRFVAQNHSALAKVFRLVTPEWETVQWAHDKRLTYQHARSLGLATPRTETPENLQQLGALALPFPVILKPRAHDARNAFTDAKAWRANDPAALLARYQEAAALVGEQGIVVQELIPGRGSAQFSYAAVWWAGQPVGSLVARRARQYPIDFGFTSTCVETVEQPEVESAARLFLASLQYSGLVEIEFKFDVREQQYKILDVNARSWTWLALGSAAGVDFADLLWRLAMGEKLTPVRGRCGVTWLHAAHDLAAAFQEGRAGTLTLRDWARSFARCRALATFAPDDPVPGLIELPLVAARRLARRVRARRVANANAERQPRVA